MIRPAPASPARHPEDRGLARTQQELDGILRLLRAFLREGPRALPPLGQAPSRTGF